ncbi:MAG: phospho-2-dehydro-3-deoxyheptonate aldolase [Phycisphaeraceae bacterium]|nr:MAG: phospho-2-dehydro-3-deoxyheptonate aldolase [Phycisphaeraceae bacterium]
MGRICVDLFGSQTEATPRRPDAGAAPTIGRRDSVASGPDPADHESPAVNARPNQAEPDPATDGVTPEGWTPASWRERLEAHQVVYTDPAAVVRAKEKLASLPPLVTSWEIERLKGEIAQAQQGKRLILQGGDCAETLADCRPEVITAKLKILLQMSLVLIHELKKPVTRVGRFAGQYAKPRSSPTETGTVDGKDVELPSYFGDLVNSVEFAPDARTPDPHLMVRGYQHAAMTLNFIRSLLEGGFADLHHPEYWDLRFLEQAGLSADRRAAYERMTRNLADGITFMENLGEAKIDDLTRVEFFTSHEGLNLVYESAQTRRVPRRPGYYDLTTHLPWIGERTRQLDGAHVEFFRGVRNPVGIKLGPKTDPDDVVKLIDTMNPTDEAGRVVLIARMGAGNVADRLPPLLERVKKEGRTVLWMSDPMHGNGTKTASGIKTRSFDAILSELQSTARAHREAGTILGGVHFELTGEDVAECVGGAAGVGEQDLRANFASPCDPRLNYQQSLELAFLLAAELGGG